MLTPKQLTVKFAKHFEVIEKLTDFPNSLYLYGGALRDFIMFGECKSDYDFLGVFNFDLISKAYSHNVLGRWDEVSTVKLLHNNTTYDITSTDNISRTLKSNDITVSNLAINKFGEIIDVVGGLDSIAKKEIKINDPYIKVLKDPSRILRVLRLSIYLGFHIESETYKACVTHIDKLKIADCPFELEQINGLTSEQKHRLKQNLKQIGEDHERLNLSPRVGTAVVNSVSYRIVS